MKFIKFTIILEIALSVSMFFSCSVANTEMEKHANKELAQEISSNGPTNNINDDGSFMVLEKKNEGRFETKAEGMSPSFFSVLLSHMMELSGKLSELKSEVGHRFTDMESRIEAFEKKKDTVQDEIEGLVELKSEVDHRFTDIESRMQVNERKTEEAGEEIKGLVERQKKQDERLKNRDMNLANMTEYWKEELSRGANQRDALNATITNIQSQSQHRCQSGTLVLKPNVHVFYAILTKGAILFNPPFPEKPAIVFSDPTYLSIKTWTKTNITYTFIRKGTVMWMACL